MPAKNSLNIYVPNQYYHVYNRGVAKQSIFLDAEDKRKFLSILARHLDISNGEKRYDGVTYEKFPDLELLCFCLMGNHFHLLFMWVMMKRPLSDVFSKPAPHIRCISTENTSESVRYSKASIGPQ